MRKLLSYLMCSAIVMMSINVANAENNEIKVERIAGNSRYETAVEISKKYFETAPNVVLASGEGYADALVGGSLVSQEKIPMFLTKKTSLPLETKEELIRLKTKNVYILGGNNTISQSVENQIKNMGINVKRLSGEDRLATAGMIASERFYLAQKDNPNVAMGDRYAGIDGYNYADALVAGSIIGQIENQVYVFPYLKNNEISQGFAYEFAFGGYNSIPKNVEVTTRIAGENRYETSVEAAEKFEMLTGKKLKTVILVDGMNYPDALAASTVAGKEESTVITTPKDKLNKEAKKFIKNNAIDKVIVIGGENSVGNSVVAEINDEEDLSANLLGGWKIVGNKKYYYESGKIVTGWKNVDGYKYYFNDDGTMHTGWYYGKYKDSSGISHDARYYFSIDGSLAKEGTIIDGWITQASGVSNLQEDSELKIIKEYLSKNMPDVFKKIESNEYRIYKESETVNGKGQFNITALSDYWQTVVQGVIKEGSNKILYKIQIDPYSGNISLVN